MQLDRELKRQAGRAILFTAVDGMLLGAYWTVTLWLITLRAWWILPICIVSSMLLGRNILERLKKWGSA